MAIARASLSWPSADKDALGRPSLTFNFIETLMVGLITNTVYDLLKLAILAKLSLSG
jgi:hypothetical protein